MNIFTFFTPMIQSTRSLWNFGQTVLGIIFRHPITGTSII
ncbi:MAG: NUDIX hydrolase, partial [Aphanizomenon sp.]